MMQQHGGNPTKRGDLSLTYFFDFCGPEARRLWFFCGPQAHWLVRVHARACAA
jgi:hypothetical protein